MRFSILGIALSLCSLATRGQDLKRFEVSGFGGYLFGGTVMDNRFDYNSPSGPVTERGRVQFDHGGSYGIRFGYRLSRWLHVEAQASTSYTPLVFTHSNPDTQLEMGYRTSYYLGSFIIELPGERIRPFAAIGAGATRYNPDGPGIDETRFTGTFGMGLKAFLNPHWGLRIDARGYATSIKENGSFGYFCYTNRFDGPGGTVIPVPCERRGWVTRGEVGGGVVFAF